MADPGRRLILQIRQECRAGMLAARVHGQVDEIIRKDSSNGKPYWELKLRDASEALLLRAWSDTPAFSFCEEIARGDCVEIEGDFFINGTFGMDARKWKIRGLSPEETKALFAGTNEESAAVENDFFCIREMVANMADPRLKALCEAFLQDYGERFRRAAAARVNHHAHRGGLLRHTSQMMRSASALCGVYDALNRDLLLAGTIFHDSGKLWEMCPPETGFEMPRELRGELLGHISIGIELVNALWRKLPLDEWKTCQPPSENVRLHLLHLIASHHGELQFGSPVAPKTPEAIALHFVDNIDARLEMFISAYASQPDIAPGILDRVRPLGVSPVRPLPKPVESQES